MVAPKLQSSFLVLPHHKHVLENGMDLGPEKLENHHILTRLSAREIFSEFCRRESFRTYNINGSYQLPLKFWQRIQFKYLLTYLLTPWCRVLLVKLAGLQLVKKFPVFYGTRRFITALTSVRHLSLSWASTTQSTYPHPTSCSHILIQRLNSGNA